MAGKQTPPTPPAVPPAADAPEQPSSPLPKTITDWSTLAAPVAMANRQGPSGIKVNVLESVPAPIRERAEASLTINAERVKAKASSSAKRARIDYHWQLQAVADQAMGEQFVKLITKYAKYRPSEGDIPHAGPTSPKGQVTARTGNVDWFRKIADGEYVQTAKTTEGAFMGVRYSVRPFEQRGDTARLPGSA
jgi:hypothetical protein